MGPSLQHPAHIPYTVPVQLRTLALSEPAKSIRCRKERVRATGALGSVVASGRSEASMERRMIVWEREDPSLKAVALTCRQAQVYWWKGDQR